MLITQDNDRHYHVAESVEDLLEHVATIPQDRLDAVGLESNYYLHKQGFIGRRFGDWSNVYEEARKPWTKGLEVLERMLNSLADANLPRPKSRRRKMRFSEDNGDEVDFDRLRDGRAYWRETRRRSTRGPATITILVDVGANCATAHTDILWRGAAAVAMTKLLEESGYRVELWAYSRFTGVWHDPKLQGRWNSTLLQAVCLKRPGDLVDPSTLIAAVSGWFYRTVFFRGACYGTFETKSSLGFPQPAEEKDLDQISRDPGRVSIDKAMTYGDAVKVVRAAINKLTH